jgi:hypothetical protein
MWLWLDNLVQLLPLSVFATYAFWHGPPPAMSERWLTAFLVGGAVALAQLGIAVWRRRPISPLILGVNLYLIVGAVASRARLWEVLKVYDALAESAIFGAILLVGVVTTAASSRGFVGVAHPERRRVVLASLALLAAVGLGLVASFAFRGRTTLSAALPLVLLLFVNRRLAARLAAPPS